MESREKALKDEAVEVVEAAIKRHEDFDKAIKAQVNDNFISFDSFSYCYIVSISRKIKSII